MKALSTNPCPGPTMVGALLLHSPTSNKILRAPPSPTPWLEPCSSIPQHQTKPYLHLSPPRWLEPCPSIPQHEFPFYQALPQPPPWLEPCSSIPQHQTKLYVRLPHRHHGWSLAPPFPNIKPNHTYTCHLHYGWSRAPPFPNMNSHSTKLFPTPTMVGALLLHSPTANKILRAPPSPTPWLEPCSSIPQHQTKPYLHLSPPLWLEPCSSIPQHQTKRSLHLSPPPWLEPCSSIPQHEFPFYQAVPHPHYGRSLALPFPNINPNSTSNSPTAPVVGALLLHSPTSNQIVPTLATPTMVGALLLHSPTSNQIIPTLVTFTMVGALLPHSPT